MENEKNILESQSELPSKNDVIIILSVGKNYTGIYADGRVYGEGIRSIDFSKYAGEIPELCVDAGVLPIVGEGGNEHLKGFLDQISNEIKKHISEN